MMTTGREPRDPHIQHRQLEPLLDTLQVAAILRCSRQTIHNWRSKGGHELFDKGFLPLGVQGGLRWLADDVRAYIEGLTQRTTPSGRRGSSADPDDD